ncbi:hypothetical protein QTP88_026909 [Uroleucon formosanum]
MPAHAVPSSLPLLLPPPPAVQYAPAEPRFRRCVRKFFAHLFSNLGLFGLVAGYVIVGAFVFRFLEAGNERQQRDRIGRLKNDCLGELWNITGIANKIEFRQKDPAGPSHLRIGVGEFRRMTDVDFK